MDFWKGFILQEQELLHGQSLLLKQRVWRVHEADRISEKPVLSSVHAMAILGRDGLPATCR